MPSATSAVLLPGPQVAEVSVAAGSAGASIGGVWALHRLGLVDVGSRR